MSSLLGVEPVLVSGAGPQQREREGERGGRRVVAPEQDGVGLGPHLRRGEAARALRQLQDQVDELLRLP